MRWRKKHKNKTKAINFYCQKWTNRMPEQQITFRPQILAFHYNEMSKIPFFLKFFFCFSLDSAPKLNFYPPTFFRSRIMRQRKKNIKTKLKRSTFIAKMNQQNARATNYFQTSNFGISLQWNAKETAFLWVFSPEKNIQNFLKQQKYKKIKWLFCRYFIFV